MPPAIRGSAAAAAATAGNVATPATLSPALPAHQAGDLLLCFTACRSATPTVATPSGWTQLLNVTGTNGRIALFGKIAASASETAPSVTWSSLTTGTSGTPAQAQCAVFSGVLSPLTVDVTGTVENGAAATATSASGTAITTLTDQDLVLALSTRLDDAGTWSAPAGFTLIDGVGTTSGLDFATGWAFQVKTPAGSVAPADFGLAGASSFASSGVLVGLKGVISSTVTGAANLSGAGALGATGDVQVSYQKVKATLASYADVKAQRADYDDLLHGVGGAVTVSGAAALSGSGSLAATGTRTVPGAAALTGLGSASADGVTTRLGAAALSGVGTAQAAGTRTVLGAAALSGAGQASASGVATVGGAAALSGSGSLAAAGNVGAGPATIFGSASLSGVGTLSASAVRTAVAAAALSGVGSLATSGYRTSSGQAALTGTGALSGSGTTTRSGAAALSGLGSATVTSTRRTVLGQAALTGQGSLAASPGAPVVTGAAALTGLGSLLVVVPTIKDYNWLLDTYITYGNAKDFFTDYGDLLYGVQRPVTVLGDADAVYLNNQNVERIYAGANLAWQRAA